MNNPNLDQIQKEAIRLLAYVERVRKLAHQGEQPDADTLMHMRLSADAVKSATFAMLEGHQCASVA